MEIKGTAIIGACLLAATAIGASLPKPGEISSSGASTLIGTPEGVVTVTPLGPSIFKISRLPLGESNYEFPGSQAAVLTPSTEGITWSADGREVVFKSATTTLKVDRTTGHATFLDAIGNVILDEAAGVDNRGSKKSVSLRTGKGENFYGAGERGHSLRLNGDTLSMFNRQNYGYGGGDPRLNQMGISVPWVVSDAGYGVLFDDYNRAQLTLGRDSIVYESETPKALSYYFVNGEGSMATATGRYSVLTGRQPLPPFWTLGYITSRYGYHNEQEALGAIDSLKTRGYPVDGIVFDLYWYGKETDMGRLEWNPEQFPDHRKMLDSLRSQGVHTVLINQPYINKIGAIDNYNMLSEAGMLVRDSAGATHDVTTWVGDAGMFDMSNPATRGWLWNRLRDLTADGVSGWWGDLGEPEVHPLSMVHDNGETASQYHNVYGNEWSRLIYEGLRADYPEMRPMLMMRGGTAGLQRYSVFPWTTDVARSWAGLEPQVTLMLNSGLSGLGYMGSDVGGFAVDPDDPYQPELYVRWLQMGTFSPMLRTHAQLKPEPYHYPQQDAIIKKFIKERYQWLPYNYTLAYENAANGIPLARPVNFRAKGKEAEANITDEYLWGDEVLIAPVMKKGARSRKVKFPAGSEWVNWNNTRLTYKGGTTATVAAPLDELPMFVRAGSFIPLYPKEIENVDQYDSRFLTVKYFPAKEASDYTLFDDDRKSPESLEKGEYQLTTFAAIPQGRNLEIDIESKGSYSGMPESRMITLEIPGIAKPASVAIDGTKVLQVSTPKALRSGGWTYDSSKRTLTVGVTFGNNPMKIEIKR